MNNISFDLMYGLPGQTHATLKTDLERSLNLGVKHLSYYSLILEEHTLFALWQQAPKDEKWILEADDLIQHFLKPMDLNIMKSAIMLNRVIVRSIIWSIGEMKAMLA